MRIPIYQVDAFTSKVFSGNPAAVCLLNDWISDSMLQAIAAENNLSETAFIVQKGDGVELRWFTPKTEVALCGHATLASAYVLFELPKMAGEDCLFSDSQEWPTHCRKRIIYSKWTSHRGRPPSSGLRMHSSR